MPTTVPSVTRPAGLCVGSGHLVVYGNPAFVAQFGDRCLGMPAREVLVDVPSAAFELLDAVFERGQPLARWITRRGQDWRMTAMPRREPGSTAVYGVAFHLRARTDLPVVDDVRGDR